MKATWPVQNLNMNDRYTCVTVLAQNMTATSNCGETWGKSQSNQQTKPPRSGDGQLLFWQGVLFLSYNCFRSFWRDLLYSIS